VQKVIGAADITGAIFPPFVVTAGA
jgi:hypothetical protein